MSENQSALGRVDKTMLIGAIVATAALLIFAVVVSFTFTNSTLPVRGEAGLEPGAPAPTEGAAPASEPDGAALSTSAGCAACHSTDGSVLVGPSWQGLAGSERTLDDGTTVIADTAYIERAIIDPNAELVEGFAPTMPTTFGSTLSDADLAALVSYIESL